MKENKEEISSPVLRKTMGNNCRTRLHRPGSLVRVQETGSPTPT